MDKMMEFPDNRMDLMDSRFDLMVTSIEFQVNGQPVCYEGPPLRRLLDYLRDDLGLTGPKEGCGEGECGACSVLVDNHLINACLTPTGSLAGRSVTTIEGLAGTPACQVLEACFAQAGAVQCGFCTPGMILAAVALLRHDPRPDESTIREAISGNLCRCTGYHMIVEAILAASERSDVAW